MICLKQKADHITLNFLKVVFHKCYLVHSWIPWPKYLHEVKNKDVSKFSIDVVQMYLLVHSFPMHPFSTPWKHQKLAAFWNSIIWCLSVRDSLQISFRI